MKGKPTKFAGWIGIVDDKPYLELVRDTYGNAKAIFAFRSRKEARKRFQGIQKVVIEVERGPERKS